jgi:hypothetical protein
VNESGAAGDGDLTARVFDCRGAVRRVRAGWMWEAGDGLWCVALAEVKDALAFKKFLLLD